MSRQHGTRRTPRRGAPVHDESCRRSHDDGGAPPRREDTPGRLCHIRRRRTDRRLGKQAVDEEGAGVAAGVLGEGEVVALIFEVVADAGEEDAVALLVGVRGGVVAGAGDDPGVAVGVDRGLEDGVEDVADGAAGLEVQVDDFGAVLLGDDAVVALERVANREHGRVAHRHPQVLRHLDVAPPPPLRVARRRLLVDDAHDGRRRRHCREGHAVVVRLRRRRHRRVFDERRERGVQTERALVVVRVVAEGVLCGGGRERGRVVVVAAPVVLVVAPVLGERGSSRRLTTWRECAVAAQRNCLLLLLRVVVAVEAEERVQQRGGLAAEVATRIAGAVLQQIVGFRDARSLFGEQPVAPQVLV
mmetsp:Transcript_4209/g.13083  ORF Transcript_4209/g.13083 Transcript_4209/m.13083 type:complete len:359 (+) Transcript_4209:887-1963(+)